MGGSKGKGDSKGGTGNINGAEEKAWQEAEETMAVLFQSWGEGGKGKRAEEKAWQEAEEAMAVEDQSWEHSEWLEEVNALNTAFLEGRAMESQDEMKGKGKHEETIFLRWALLQGREMADLANEAWMVGDIEDMDKLEGRQMANTEALSSRPELRVSWLPGSPVF